MITFTHPAIAEPPVCAEMYSSLKPIIECGKNCYLSTYPAERSHFYPGNDATHDSYVYELTVPNGDKEHVIEIIIPKTRQSSVVNAAISISKALMALPETHISSTTTVRINKQAYLGDDHWRSKYTNFTASMGTAGKGNIDLYPSSFKDFLDHSEFRIELMRHEHGHNIAHKIFGSADPPEQYIQLAALDNIAVSEYGKNSMREDFAEAVRVYLQTEGGQKDWTQRVKFKNRFAYLDELFGITPPRKTPDVSFEAQQLLKIAEKDPGQQALAFQIMKAIFQGYKGAVVKNTAKGILIFIPAAGAGYLLTKDGSFSQMPENHDLK